LTRSQQLQIATDWFSTQGWKPFKFQSDTWKKYWQGKSGIVNAATGSGKTYSLILPILVEFLSDNHKKKALPKKNGLQAIWITPIKALAKEIQSSAQKAATDLGIEWDIAIRTGDTSSSDRAKQKRQPPEILITTPESLHLLIGQRYHEDLFKNLKVLVADEWHELVGSKRGVQVELALSRLKAIKPKLKIWGISATLGNMEEAASILFGDYDENQDWSIIKSPIRKKIRIETILPNEIDKLPWAGHLGLHLMDKVVDVIIGSKTTLLFTNTRNQCERWYQSILEYYPDFAGIMAMHHSAMDRTQREWVEQSLHDGVLQLVVCTSSLDLGVDFRPVETVIQIGSPKGVARFLQRAGRSGHQPGAESVIYFVPTHSLELLESAALRRAIKRNNIESRKPYIRSFDVLAQYLVTLSLSDGFMPDQILGEVRKTFAFSSISDDEWDWILAFIHSGGAALDAYDEYNRVGVINGRYHIQNKALATRHRMSMGTIVGNTTMQVKYLKGSKLGRVEERFISALSPGEVFMFAGRALEIVKIRSMEVLVKKSKKKTTRTPSWNGGRMPFSSRLSEELRYQIDLVYSGKYNSIELKMLAPLIELQQSRSHIPSQNEFLVEYFKDREGYHLLMYPYEGRFVNEGLSTLLAYRISQQMSISFSIAMNDYGFELLSDQAIDVDKMITHEIFSTDGLTQDISSSANKVEMARRKFRDIAAIAGLIFKGFPGQEKRTRHLQSSSQLFFDMFSEYEPNNLLILQAYEEVLYFQLEEDRMRTTLERIQNQNIIIARPNKATPFAFPIMVDRMRETLTSETLQDRIQKMRIKLIE